MFVPVPMRELIDDENIVLLDPPSIISKREELESILLLLPAKIELFVPKSELLDPAPIILPPIVSEAVFPIPETIAELFPVS